MAAVSRPNTRHRVAHAAALGAGVLAALALLCWATEVVADAPPARAVLAVLGASDQITAAEGVAAVGWAIIAGALIGALLAVFGNVLSNLGRSPRAG